MFTHQARLLTRGCSAITVTASCVKRESVSGQFYIKYREDIQIQFNECVVIHKNETQGLTFLIKDSFK